MKKIDELLKNEKLSTWERTALKKINYFGDEINNNRMIVNLADNGTEEEMKILNSARTDILISEMWYSRLRPVSTVLMIDPVIR